MSYKFSVFISIILIILLVSACASNYQSIAQDQFHQDKIDDRIVQEIFEVYLWAWMFLYLAILLNLPNK